MKRFLRVHAILVALLYLAGGLFPCQGAAAALPGAADTPASRAGAARDPHALHAEHPGAHASPCGAADLPRFRAVCPCGCDKGAGPSSSAAKTGPALPSIAALPRVRGREGAPRIPSLNHPTPPPANIDHVPI